MSASEISTCRPAHVQILGNGGVELGYVKANKGASFLTLYRFELVKDRRRVLPSCCSEFFFHLDVYGVKGLLLKVFAFRVLTYPFISV